MITEETKALHTSEFQEELALHMAELKTCRSCALMQSAPVVPVFQPAWRQGGILLLGQAPGIREPSMSKCFAWTAGKTLFRWISESTGVDEDEFRQRVYIAATCRCFPGKAKSGGGDRAPSREEMATCEPWLQREMALLRPTLVLAVGRLAISKFITHGKLDEVIGRVVPAQMPLPEGAPAHFADVLPLPHPSGASTWHRMEPGKTLLQAALMQLAGHPAWRESFKDC